MPERSALNLAQLPSNILLQHLQRKTKLRSLRLSHQQMDVLGHDYISRDIESVPFSGLFQGLLEDVTCPRCSQAWCSSIAAERYKVEASRFLKSFQTPRHALNRNPGSRAYRSNSENNFISDSENRKNEKGVKTPALSLQNPQRRGRGTRTLI